MQCQRGLTEQRSIFCLLLLRYVLLLRFDPFAISSYDSCHEPFFRISRGTVPSIKRSLTLPPVSSLVFRYEFLGPPKRCLAQKD